MDRQASDILRDRRWELGLTQQQVAEASEIEIAQYQRLEYGKRGFLNASMKVGLKICAALQLDPYEVVFGNEGEFDT